MNWKHRGKKFKQRQQVTHIYKFPKADVTVDIVVFGLDLGSKALQVLLIRRGKETEPFYDRWALPGGFIEMDERLGDSAARELKEETGLTLSYIEQLYTFGKPGRDPRGRVISVAYMGLARPENVVLKADDDAADARWFDVGSLDRDTLAFDHAGILEMGMRRLRGKLRWQPMGVDLLPEKFTLSELQEVYEIILGKQIDKRNFRRKVLSFGVLIETGITKTGRSGPPAKAYCFDHDAYARLRREGLDFEV